MSMKRKKIYAVYVAMQYIGLVSATSEKMAALRARQVFHTEASQDLEVFFVS